MKLINEYYLNSIFLYQLRDSEISFYDNSTFMTLMKDKKLIANAKKNYKIFILDVAIPTKITKISNYKNFNFLTIVLRKLIYYIYFFSKIKKMKI